MLCYFLLYNKVNQLYVYVYPHIPSLLVLPLTLPLPPLQVVTKRRVDIPMLCSSLPLAIHFTFGNVYVSMLLSNFVPIPLPPLCPQVRSLHLHLYSFPASRCISIIFLDYIYMRQHTFVFLFLTYFNLYDYLQVHPTHYK